MKLVTIFGGSGFVGRYIARRLAKEGWRVRVACRDPNTAGFVRTYGVVGQVEPVFCNVRDDDSVRRVLHDVDAVVNCVGSFDARGANTMEAVNAEAAGRVARLAAEMGASRLVHVSAIGADAEGDSDYARTKGEGEAAVRAAFPNAVILRPSVIFGPEDQFFNRFAGMTRFGPALPVVGGDTRFQPVFVDDVAAAVVAGVVGAAPGIYELGGPDVASFRELMQRMLDTIRKRRLVVNLPFGLAGLMAKAFSAGHLLSGGLLPQPITPDQVVSLRHDNVVGEGAKGLADLGIEPTPMEAVMEDYLWRFRPSGQYAEIKESARQLRSQR